MIRNDDFYRNTALQYCCDIVSNAYNIVPTLQRRIVPGNITFTEDSKFVCWCKYILTISFFLSRLSFSDLCGKEVSTLNILLRIYLLSQPTNNLTSGGKIEETLSSNRCISRKKQSWPLLHSNLGCLLFPPGNLNRSTTLFRGGGKAKLSVSLWCR